MAIVERLRQGFDIDDAYAGRVDKLMDAAADEIERLRAIIQNVGLAVGVDPDKVPILDPGERT